MDNNAISAILDCLQEVALLRLEIGPKEQACHAYDCVHRCANLVAHIGQEFRFCFRERFRTLLGYFKVLIGSLEFKGAKLTLSSKPSLRRMISCSALFRSIISCCAPP